MAEELSSQQRLVAATRQCLIEHGLGDCSVKRIAAIAGVNHGLIHHYFGSKDELLLEVIRQESESVSSHMVVEPERVLQDFIVPHIYNNPDRQKLLVEFLAIANRLPTARKLLSDIFSKRREEIMALMDTDDLQTATLMYGACFGMAIHYALDRTLPVEQATGNLISLMSDSKPPPAEIRAVKSPAAKPQTVKPTARPPRGRSR